MIFKELNDIIINNDKWIKEFLDPFYEKLSNKNLQLIEKNLKKNRNLDKNEYLKEMSPIYFNFDLSSYALGRYTVYKQIEEEAPEKELEFKQVNVEINSELTIKDLINTLEAEMQLGKGSIYETFLTDGGAELAKAQGLKSYNHFVEIINSKILELDYKEWLDDIQEKGINLEIAVNNVSYWQTVYNTNISSLSNYGRTIESDRLKEFISFERYNSVLDKNTTKQCNELNGKVRKRGTWGAYYPANHYNCRSVVDMISKFRAERLGIKEDKFDIRKTTIADENFNKVFSIEELTKQLQE